MADENTAPTGPLSDDQAVGSLLGELPSDTQDPGTGTPKGEEVTDAEGGDKPQDAQSQAAQRPPVDDPAEQLLESQESDSEESEEDEPDGDESKDDEGKDESDEADSDEHSDDEEEGDADEETAVLFHMEDGTPVTPDEAKRGYLRQADYTRKMQDLAQQRDQVAQAWQAREQEQQVLAEHLNMAMSTLEPRLAELSKVDWHKLSLDDPQRYVELNAEWQSKAQRYQEHRAQAEQLIQQQNQVQEQQRMQRLQQEAHALKQAMPDFADPKVGPRLRAEIAQYAREAGLTEQEAKSISDHRLIIMMDKARRFDALQKGALGAARKKVDKAPKRGIKPGSPKSASERKTQQNKDRLSRLKQSRHIDDAVDFLLNP